MRGWQELGVVDTIYEEDEDEDDESFNSLSFTPCASLSLTPSPDPSLERSVKEWYADLLLFVSPSLFPSRLRFI